jgi:hypothetical protein
MKVFYIQNGLAPLEFFNNTDGLAFWVKRGF